MDFRRVADKLLNIKDQLETLIQAQLEPFRNNIRIIFYDLTNTFFQGKCLEIEKAKSGRCKSNSKNPIETISCAIDENGFLIKTSFLPGNTAEVKTLKAVLHDLGAKKGDLVIMDRGIVSKDNLKWLVENGFYYLVASRAGKRVFDESLAIPYKMASKDVVRAYQELSEDGTTVKLFCHSNARQHKEESMIQAAMDKLEKALTDLSNGLSKPRTVKRYDKVERRVGKLIQKYQLAAQYCDVQVIQKEGDPGIAIEVVFARKEIEGSKRMMPGVYSLETNDISMEAEPMLQTYFRLTEIESVFKCWKSELGLRPVFHKKQSRVDAHLFISTLAYQFVNYLRWNLKKQGIHDSWETMRRSLSWHRTQRIVGEESQGKDLVVVNNVMEVPKGVLLYYQALGLDWKAWGKLSVSVFPEYLAMSVMEELA
jgi:transposase